MPALTVSHCKGGGSLRHNDREFFAENVDPEMSHMNVVLIKEDLDEAYERCFGEAVREYNQQQTRKDRKISDYREKIQNSGNGEKEFYETIVQFGNRDTAGFDPVTHEPTEMALLCRDMLSEYVRDFQRRNPNLHVFHAVIHMDEPKGTPHLHMDWVPVATGYKKGLQTRNSLDKALRQQGIEPSKNRAEGKHNNVTIAWHEQEKAHMGRILERHGLEKEDLNVGGTHRTVQEFKELNRIHEADMAKAKAEVDLGKPITPVFGEKYYRVPLEQAEGLKEAVADVAVWNDYSKGVEASQKAEKARLRAKEKNLDLYADKVEKRAKGAEEAFLAAQETAEQAWWSSEKPRRLLEQYPQIQGHRIQPEEVQALLEETSSLRQENQQLRRENKSLRSQLVALERSFKRVRLFLADKFGIKDVDKKAKVWADEKSQAFQQGREEAERAIQEASRRAKDERGGWER